MVLRYEVVRQDHSKMECKFFIWDNAEGCSVDDELGCTIYYDTYAEAKEECDELNAEH